MWALTKVSLEAARSVDLESAERNHRRSATKCTGPSFQEFLVDAADSGWLTPTEIKMSAGLKATPIAGREALMADLRGIQRGVMQSRSAGQPAQPAAQQAAMEIEEACLMGQNTCEAGCTSCCMH